MKKIGKLLALTLLLISTSGIFAQEFETITQEEYYLTAAFFGKESNQTIELSKSDGYDENYKYSFNQLHDKLEVSADDSVFKLDHIFNGERFTIEAPFSDMASEVIVINPSEEDKAKGYGDLIHDVKSFKPVSSEIKNIIIYEQYATHVLEHGSVVYMITFADNSVNLFVEPRK